MFEKIKLNKKIKNIQKEIDEIEQKRSRSQSALVQAILKSESPKEDDVEFFNKYTSQIDDLRNEMHKYQEEIKKLENL